MAADVVTIDEAARHFKVSRPTIYNWIRQQLLPVVALGRNAGIPRKALGKRPQTRRGRPPKHFQIFA